tara:strand:- start:13324 stop:13791 length:468 start_codon:yes stop_codon:yes gene_type:complete
MKIFSDDILPNMKINDKFIASKDFGFGCAGRNITPSFSLSDVPKEASELAFTVFDPDAPTGCGFWHWILVNIDKNISEINESVVRGSLQIRNDFGVYNYGGPCPPEGDKAHNYHFCLYALHTPIEASPNTPAAQIGFQLNFKTQAKASIIALYGR